MLLLENFDVGGVATMNLESLLEFQQYIFRVVIAKNFNFLSNSTLSRSVHPIMVNSTFNALNIDALASYYVAEEQVKFDIILHQIYCWTSHASTSTLFSLAIKIQITSNY